MSDINSQIKIHIIDSIKDGTKTSLEKLNNLLQELHKDIMNENSNMIKSSNKEENNGKNIEEENKDNDNNINQLSAFLDEVKGNQDENNEEDKERTTGDNVGDNIEKISNLINKRISGDYKNSNDINIINKRSIDFNNINNINNKNEINEIKEEDKNEEISSEKKETDKIDEKKDKYSYKPISEITLSTIEQNNLNSFNMTQGSELYLTTIIDIVGGKESEKESENLSDSVKIDPNEEIHLGLTNYQISNDEGNPSMITNQLNKAIIRTHDFTKSKDIISNIESEDPEMEKIEKNNLNKKPSKTSISDKKSAIDLFRQEPKKDENEIIKENKEQIKKEINLMYEKELNLVKINNKEKFSYITKYNDPDKDKLGYEPDYFLCSKNSINFLNRRNNFLNHKYFSYILSKNEKGNKEKEKKKKIKEKIKEEFDVNDNFIYNEEEVDKHKKNYKEKIEPIKISLNYIRANSNNQITKEQRIYDVEDMVSFFYYFKLYSPEEKFKSNLEPKSEKEIIKNFTTYRKILNDGNSFKRAFSYSLLESFILKNQKPKFEYIIYDINRILRKSNNEVKEISNILIDIKENSSIEYLMNSFNNPNNIFDEIMINYIDKSVKKVLGVENNKRKYLEIDSNILKILVNIFDVNIEIYYIEDEENNNSNVLKLNQIIFKNNNCIPEKKNLKTSIYSDNDSSTTFRFLFFLNSFYIVYTEKSDIDSTMAINNNERQYYYIDNLPTYKCPICKENTGLDIIPSSEAIFCHICLNKYLKEIIEKRVVLFIKSNFSCIEYYTRPIKISSDIIINFSLYKYITNNYITYDFEKILEKTCFKCYKVINEKNKIKKLKCLCQVCEACLEKMLKENLKDKNYLNKYEIHNMPRTKCLCGNDIDLSNLIKLSKIKPNEKDKKLAEDRLLNTLKKKCCLCHEANEQKIFDFKIMEGPVHFMCISCYDKEIKKDNNEKENEENSGDIIMNDKKIIKRKLFCKICYEEHIWIEDNDIIDKKNLLQKLEGKFKCCKENCNII